RHLPGPFVLLPLGPPLEAVGELLELERGRLGVLLAALGERLLVVPDFLRGTSPVEEEQVRRDVRIRGENPIGQPDDGVEVGPGGEFGGGGSPPPGFWGQAALCGSW